MKNADLLYRLTDPEIMERVLREGIPIQEVLEYTHEDMKHYYGIGCRLFEEERYQEASDLFFYLIFLNSHYGNLWYGYGLAGQRLGNHHEAIQAFCQAINEDPVTIDYYLQACYSCATVKEYPVLLYLIILLEETINDPEKLKPYQDKIDAFRKILEEKS